MVSLVGVRRALPAVAVLAALCGTTACGQSTGVDSGTSPSSGAPAAPSEAYQLLPDGSVPWFAEPITEQQLNGIPNPPRTPASGSRPCQAEQLSGVLDSWTRPGTGGETPRGFDAAIGKLIGEVDVRNTSQRECTLRGEVPTEMFAGGQRIPMLYTHDINAEAKRRVVVVPPGQRASLRLDWSGPFCQRVSGPFELAIQLPDDGGTLRARITSADTPTCNGPDTVKPKVRATLFSSGFGEPTENTPAVASPIAGLTVTVTGPATAPSGRPVTYRVDLGDPTAKPTALDPCPAFSVELFSQGDATNEAVSSHQLYRLNCRPVPEVPAGGTIRFEMIAQVPADMAAGRELTITWKLILPHLGQGPKQEGSVRMRIG